MAGGIVHRAADAELHVALGKLVNDFVGVPD